MGYDCYGSYLTSLRCSKAFWEGGGGGGGGGGGLYTGYKRIEGTGNKFSFILYACNHYAYTKFS